MSKTIDYAVGADGIVTLTIDLPGRSMNVLSPELMDELDVAVERIRDDDSVRGAIVTSGKSAFLAGADLKQVVGIFETDQSPGEIYRGTAQFGATLRKLETCGKPFVAAINGTALGGGLEICLACHHRIVADAPKTALGLPEVMVGLLPGAGGTQRLPRLIGIRAALPLILEGKHLSPQQALDAGIVHAVVPPGELLDAARAWLLDSPSAVQPWDERGFRVPGGAGAMHPKAVETFLGGTAMVAKKTSRNFPAPIAILSCVYEGTIVPMDAALRIEGKYFTSLLTDPVSRNMIRTLFVNKGAADKLVRRPAGVEPRPVRKLGVLGAGMMGAGIAYVSARAGQDVVLLDTDLAHAERGKAYSAKLLERRVSKGRTTRERADAVLARIQPTTDFADLDGCDLVIEAVFEDRAVKADVTRKAEAAIAADATFASNTSTLPITGLAEASCRPEQFIGIHFFSPVDRMPLVEVIVGQRTSQETIARALDYVQQIRKTPILVNDSRGFYTSRVFGTFTNEGLALLSEGVAPALIENAARLAGMPVGPLAVSDEVSIELMYHVGEQTRKDLGSSYQAPPSAEVVRRFVEDLDRKGKRHGKGFYDYPEGGRKRLWPGLAEIFPPAAEQPSAEEVGQRLLYVQALETARCMEEGVLTSAAEADVGSVLGWGFPAHTGGTLSLIDTVGVRIFVDTCARLAEVHGARFAPSDWLRERAERGQPFHPTGGD